MSIGLDAQCPKNCMCLCCQEARQEYQECAGCGRDDEEMHQVGKQFVCDACMGEEEERAEEVNR